MSSTSKITYHDWGRGAGKTCRLRYRAKCEQCGGEYWRASNQRFCADECRYEFHNEQKRQAHAQAKKKHR